MNPTVDVIVLV